MAQAADGRSDAIVRRAAEDPTNDFYRSAPTVYAAAVAALFVHVGGLFVKRYLSEPQQLVVFFGQLVFGVGLYVAALSLSNSTLYGIAIATAFTAIASLFEGALKQ